MSHHLSWPSDDTASDRRRFMQLMLASPIAASLWQSHVAFGEEALPSADDARNVFDFHDVAQEKLSPAIYDFIMGGADDEKTIAANRTAFDKVQIRARRLIDVSNIDTSITLFGTPMATPILIAPIGGQVQVHEQGELATARAAYTRKHTMIASTVTNHSIGEIAEAHTAPVWFQLYASSNRDLVRHLLRNAKEAGCETIALTVDSAALGNRERQMAFGTGRGSGPRQRLGNFEGFPGPPIIGDPSLTWDFIKWLRDETDANILLKGIVTHEDASLCVTHGVDGLIISNHGGRQEESHRGTLEALPEIIAAVDGKVPVLIDGGFRRGTDIFKALAMGASAICIGRPYIWGLASFGEDGVAKVLDLLRAELVRIMKLSGTPSIAAITPAHVNVKF